MDLNYHQWSSASSLKNFLHISYNGSSVDNKATLSFILFFKFENVFFCLHFLRHSLLDMRSLVDGLGIFARCWLCYTTTFWSPLFLKRSQLFILLGLPGTISVNFLLLLSSFPLSPSTLFTMMGLSMDFFVVTLFGIYCVSWMCKLFLSNLGSIEPLFLLMFFYSFLSVIL